MATEVSQDPPNVLPKYLTYSRSKVPLLGALIDYVDTSVQYLRRKTFAQAETLNEKASRATLSATFLAFVCLMLGVVCNVKFEVVTVDAEPLRNDLHFMLMSREDKLYIDDIDVTRVKWCVEASDGLVILISSLLIWNSSNVVTILCFYVEKVMQLCNKISELEKKHIE